eukprot:37239-Rhodomonas_salina.1
MGVRSKLAQLGAGVLIRTARSIPRVPGTPGTRVPGTGTRHPGTVANCGARRVPSVAAGCTSTVAARPNARHCYSGYISQGLEEFEDARSAYPGRGGSEAARAAGAPRVEQSRYPGTRLPGFSRRQVTRRYMQLGRAA